MGALSVKPEEVARLKGLGFLNNTGTDNFSARIITVNGIVDTDKMKAVQELADKYGSGKVGLTTRLTFEVQGIPYEKCDEFVKAVEDRGMLVGGTGPKVRPVVSCKGTICHYGQIDTFGLSEKLHEEFYIKWHDVKLPHKFKIAVGGCPNNCVKPDLNDFSVTGRTTVELDVEKCKKCKVCKVAAACPMKAMVKAEGEVISHDVSKCISCGRCVHLGNDGNIDVCPFGAVKPVIRGGYDIAIGGHWGKSGDKGESIGVIAKSEDEVIGILTKTLEYFRDNGTPGERFANLIKRVGLEEVKKAILS